MARARVGTAGWSYPQWRGAFYPRDIARRDWLSHLAGRLPMVELNATFYRLPSPDRMTHWRDATPPAFRFAVKLPRRISHDARLADCGEALAAFLDRVGVLGNKADTLLIQLPPKFPPDVARLDAFLAALPEAYTPVIEFRDPRWHTDATHDVLRRRAAAFVIFELGRDRSPAWVTADRVYVRLHGRQAKYRGRYTDAELAEWADFAERHVAAGRDVDMVFDNTKDGDDAIANALTLRDRLAARGSLR